MQLEEGTLVEIGVSVVAVGLFVAIITYIGATHGRDQLTDPGPLLIIGAVFGFVVLMTVVGVFLDRR